jgi:hypothetical protein
MKIIFEVHNMMMDKDSPPRLTREMKTIMNLSDDILRIPSRIKINAHKKVSIMYDCYPEQTRILLISDANSRTCKVHNVGFNICCR